MKKQYDVVIVGGAHAGTIAGKFAALHGLETLILEKQRQVIIQDSMAIVYDLPECEEVIGATVDPRCIHAPAKGMLYYSPSGIEGEPHHLEGAFVDRNVFERFLRGIAIKAGAEVILGARAVDLVKENGVVKGVMARIGKDLVTIKSKIVIGADGSYGSVARWAGLRGKVAYNMCGMGYEMVGVKRLGSSPIGYDEFYLGSFNSGNYGFVVPYDDERVTMGCSRRVGLEYKPTTLKQNFENFKKHLEKIGRYNFDKASPVNMMSGGELIWQETGLSYNMVTDGVILAGVGGGKPLLANRRGAPGMCFAWYSGRWAAEAAAAAIKENDLSAKSLKEKYEDRIVASSEGHRETMLEARKLWAMIAHAKDEYVDHAIKEISASMEAAHFYHKGGKELTSACVGPMRDWAKENLKGNNYSKLEYWLKEPAKN